MGSRPDGRSAGLPAAKPPQTMLSRSPAAGTPDRAELSSSRHERRALTASRHGCVHCHRTPLVGEVVYLYGEAARLRAVPAAAPETPERPRSCARRSTTRSAGPSARRLTGAAALFSGRRGPRRVNITIDRPREEVFEYLADIANHSGVHATTT